MWKHFFRAGLSTCSASHFLAVTTQLHVLILCSVVLVS